MRPNILFEKLRAGQVVLGLSNMYPAPGIIECMCRGWDFVWIDAQHGQIGNDAALHAVQAAAAAGVETLLRVPGHEEGLLGPYADLSPSAIMVPMVNDAQQARTIVQRLRFPPLGDRSYGGRRLIDVDGREYYQRNLLLVAQIETLEAVENAAAIIGTEGIDLLFFGPDDMKIRMGIQIDTTTLENAQLQEAMKKTAAAARATGKSCGTVAAGAEVARMAIDMGYQLIAGGGDVAFLRTLSGQRLTELKAVVDATGKGEKQPESGTGVY